MSATRATPTPAAASAAPSAAFSPEPTTARQPFLPPASCATTAWTFARRGDFSAYWLQGADLAAGNPVGVLFVGANKVQWQPAGDPAIQLLSRRLDGDSPPAAIENQNTILGSGATSSTVSFPRAGCWSLHATRTSSVLDATVYIYPESCRTQYGLATSVPDASARPCAP
jgi:hypothetical protein